MLDGLKDIPAADREQYLIDVIKELTTSPEGAHIDVDLGGGRMRVLQLLYARRGKPVSKDALYMVAGVDVSTPMAVTMCHVRKAVRESGLPWEIKTIRGFGYQLN